MSLIHDRAGLVKLALTVFASALLGTLMALVYAGVFIWNLSFLTSPALGNPYDSGSPFTLAQVMAIFGAFGLAAGFSDRVERKLKQDMRRVAICHFVSALCFCLLGLLLPATPYANAVRRGRYRWILDHSDRGSTIYSRGGGFVLVGYRRLAL